MVHICSFLFSQCGISVPFGSPKHKQECKMCDSSALSIVGIIPLPVIFNVNVFSFCFRRLNFRLKSGERTSAFFYDILLLFLAWPPTQISLLKCPCNANQSLTLHNWHHPLIHNPRAIISIPTIFKQGVMVNQMRNEKPVLNPSDMSNITGWVFDLFISEGISPPSGNSATSGSRQIILANREN